MGKLILKPEIFRKNIISVTRLDSKNQPKLENIEVELNLLINIIINPKSEVEAIEEEKRI
jgi:hypothetical protein